MKSFITKLLSTTLVLLISLSLININMIEAKDAPDPRAYEFTIPATVQVNGDNPSFTIEGGYSPDGFSSFIINISSNNGFKLISDENVELSYELLSSILDDTEITTKDDYIEYKTSLTDNKFSKTFNININSSATYAGNYKDILTFEIKTTLKEYGITYYLCDGEVSWKDDYTALTTYTVLDTINLPTEDNISHPDNYHFHGWYLNDSYDGDPITTFSGLDHIGGITLYAKWDVIVTNELPIAEEETPIEEVVEETKEEDETTEQEMVEEEKKEEETAPEVVEEIVNEEEANN